MSVISSPVLYCKARPPTPHLSLLWSQQHWLPSVIIYVNVIMYWVCVCVCVCVCVLESVPPFILLPHVSCYNAKTLSWCSVPYTTVEVRLQFQQKHSNTVLWKSSRYTLRVVLCIRFFDVWNVVSQWFCADRLALGHVTSFLPACLWMDIDMVNLVQY